MFKKFLAIILPFTVSFLPILTLILYPFGYSVSLTSYEIPSAISAVICIASVYLLKNYKTDKSSHILILLLPVFQFANAIIYITKSKSVAAAVFTAICFAACAFIGKKFSKSDKAKTFSVLSSSLMFLVIASVCFVTFILGSFSVNTVIETIESPDEKYYAEVVDSDQGALGGNTVIYLKKSDSLQLFILEIFKTPELIYIGEWGEYETMEIEWASSDTLLIDSAEYKIRT